MPVAQRDSAFLNIPYDRAYEDRFLAYIAGLTAFGLYPRATLELTSGDRRLDRIFELISACRYSFHDLSLVKLDRKHPPTPRFNTPFELGLVAGWQKAAPSGHTRFVFEASPYRLQKSLSDLNGTDPFIYGERAEGILSEIRNALARRNNQPTVHQMRSILESLKADVPRIKKNAGATSLFEAGAFAELVVVARRHAELDIPALKDS